MKRSLENNNDTRLTVWRTLVALYVDMDVEAYPDRAWPYVCALPIAIRDMHGASRGSTVYASKPVHEL